LIDMRFGQTQTNCSSCECGEGKFRQSCMPTLRFNARAYATRLPEAAFVFISGPVKINKTST
jgi:hypothetical protein